MQYKNANRDILRSAFVGLAIILFAIVLIFHEHSVNQVSGKEIPVEFRLANNSATINPGSDAFAIQRTWISNDGGFKILNFKDIQFLENKKTDIQIVLLSRLFRNYFGNYVVQIQYFLLNQEDDYPPDLS
jgi:hypothetical protein